MLRIYADYHTHTVFSHGKGTPEENVLSAVSKGLRRVAISEHAPAHIFYGVRGEKLIRLRREIDRLNVKYGDRIEVLMGLECNLTGNGLCDVPKDSSMFDLLILGYHKGVFPSNGFSLRAFLQLMGIGLDPTGNAEAVARAVERYKITFVSHPGLYIPMDIDVLAQMSAALKVPLEINGARVTLTKAQLERAMALGASFIINSDAHTAENVGNVGTAIAAAERAGVEELVVNLERC